jgi:hypothetical protein
MYSLVRIERNQKILSTVTRVFDLLLIHFVSSLGIMQYVLKIYLAK